MIVLEWIIEIASWISILGGCFFLIIGAIGSLRFPDFWTRIHAISVSDSAGMLLLIFGMCLQAGLSLITVKLIIIGAFLFITGPTSSHAVANAAMVSGFLPRGADEFRRERPKLDKKERKLKKQRKSPLKGKL